MGEKQSMRLLLLVVVMALLYSHSSSASGTGTMQIKVYYPDARLQHNDFLVVRGSGLPVLGNWDHSLRMEKMKDQANQWTLSISYTPMTDGSRIVQFKVLIGDRTWSVGANAVFRAPSDDGNHTVELWPFFFTGKGTIERIRNVYSPQLKNYRDLSIYLPPSYYENTLKPIQHVLIAHDGQNLFDPSTAFMNMAWMCQDTCDGLIREGRMEEIAIIGVWNTADRMSEYTYSYDASEKVGGKGDIYLDFISQTVLPLVQSKYRLSQSRDSLGILGSSLGGIISCYAAWTRSNVYSKAGCMSSSFWWNNEDFNNVILVDRSNPTPKLNALYMDSGTEGPGQDDKKETVTVRDHILHSWPDVYSLNHTLFYYLDVGAEHNEKFWGARFWIPMTNMYPPQPLPVT